MTKEMEASGGGAIADSIRLRRRAVAGSVAASSRAGLSEALRLDG